MSGGNSNHINAAETEALVCKKLQQQLHATESRALACGPWQNGE